MKDSELEYYYDNVCGHNFIHPYDKKAFESGHTILFSTFLTGEATYQQRNEWDEVYQTLDEYFTHRVKKSYKNKRHCAKVMINSKHIGFAHHKKVLNFNQRRKDIKLYINTEFERGTREV